MSLQVVHVRVNDAATGQPTPVRIRFSTPNSRYLAPLGRLETFPTGWNQDVGGHVTLGDKRYAYIDGSCEILLPEGPIQIEIAKGPEVRPIEQTWDRKKGQISLRLKIERAFDPANEGWCAGDSRAHFLSSHAALLEGRAEGLHIVNVLASEWRSDDARCVSNVLEFSGQSPALAVDDCQVVVNTLNRHPTEGEVALLNCHRIVFPLDAGREGFERWTLEDWCDQCHRKGGLVVWPNFPCNRIDSSATGDVTALHTMLARRKIDAVEWTQPMSPSAPAVAEWYRLLDRGSHVPLVGGSGKTSNATPVGSMRAYAQIVQGEPFAYKAWIEGIRAGRTVVSSGPFLQFSVNGASPGGVVPLTCRDQTIEITASAQSVTPFDAVELIHNGEVIAKTYAADLHHSLCLSEGAWFAARVLSSGMIVAHASAVLVM